MRKTYGKTKALAWKGFVMFSVVTSLGASFFPYPARAGFMSTLAKLIGSVNNATDSMAGLIAVFPPLLGAPASGSGENDSTDTPVQVQLREEEYADALMISQNNALVASRNPAGTLLDPEHDAITVYTVRPGDSPGIIAQRFGVSLNTILWANDIKKPNLIKAGDQLIILPVSGIQYDVKKGDTLESIAQRFKPRSGTTDAQGLIADIVSFNGLVVNETLDAGATIIIPDGELGSSPKSSPTPAPRSTQPRQPQAAQQKTVQFTQNDNAYYVRPVMGGTRTRGIHGINGVDLANSCGVPVLAAAEGTVILARPSGWNGGYGDYIIVTHPNGTQTLYAHLNAIYVQVGQKVTQAMQIGDIGTTGNSTGCHLHFEVRGARNPF